MTAHIQGMGWVTPLGNDLDEVWYRLMNGDRGAVKEISSPHSKRTHDCIPVPPRQVEAIGRNPRLRRSSAISYFTAAAALAALENAGLKMTPELASRTALVFSISSGGVIYTRRFYEAIVKQDATAASPLLFPETVYNAPASHLAALLGITGATYTLVGDATVGMSALQLAAQLIGSGDIDQCIVVGGEEVDWVLCEAYGEWRLIGREVPLGEGAAALVLGQHGRIGIQEIHEGVPFFNRVQSRAAISRVHRELTGEVDGIVCSANGSFVDVAERAAIRATRPTAQTWTPKLQLGEAIGAGALMQTVLGALMIEHGEANAVLVSVLGFNQQAGGAIVARQSIRL